MDCDTPEHLQAPEAPDREVLARVVQEELLPHLDDGLVHHDRVRPARPLLGPRRREDLKDAVDAADVGAPVALRREHQHSDLQQRRKCRVSAEAEGPRLAVHLVVVGDGPRLVGAAAGRLLLLRVRALLHDHPSDEPEAVLKLSLVVSDKVRATTIARPRPRKNNRHEGRAVRLRRAVPVEVRAWIVLLDEVSISGGKRRPEPLLVLRGLLCSLGLAVHLQHRHRGHPRRRAAAACRLPPAPSTSPGPRSAQHPTGPAGGRSRPVRPAPA
mmetsp:Transcript_125600/g.355306  ORF Transcript_125600/g.355306 Transcript_125600/m.355306 type:complete len:270 (+) Transcript_125600:719-1528(+)